MFKTSSMTLLVGFKPFTFLVFLHGKPIVVVKDIKGRTRITIARES
jgi:hypothetical protein